MIKSKSEFLCGGVNEEGWHKHLCPMEKIMYSLLANIFTVVFLVWGRSGVADSVEDCICADSVFAS